MTMSSVKHELVCQKCGATYYGRGGSKYCIECKDSLMTGGSKDWINRNRESYNEYHRKRYHLKKNKENKENKENETKDMPNLREADS